MDWNDAEEARLRALWAEGHSGTEIGRQMGRSKNSIVGRAHRLELPARLSPIQAAVARTGAQRDAMLMQLAGQGHSQRQIAGRLQISLKALEVAAQRLGVVLPATPPRVEGLTGPGAEAVRRARENTEKLRAEAFRRHAQPGGGVVNPGAAAHPIPASAGVPTPKGYPGAAAGCGDGVSSLQLPPAVVVPRPGALLGQGARGCRWPMWNNRERPTQVFCDAPVRLRRGGEPCVYCAGHAAVAFVDVREAPRAVARSTYSWGAQVA